MGSNVANLPTHSKRVEAWVWVILNPVIDGLGREVGLLGTGNLSWRSYSRKCEYIRPIMEYIEAIQQPNYEDFLADQLNATFEESFKKHDRQVLEVESSAAQFFDRLMQSNLFRSEVREMLKEYQGKVTGDPQYPDLDMMKDDLPKYVAEYLINKTELLPQHYMAHKFWEKYKSQFETLSSDEFERYRERQPFMALEKAAKTLHDDSSKLVPGLRNHRQMLCRTYDIPAAPVLPDRGNLIDALHI